MFTASRLEPGGDPNLWSGLSPLDFKPPKVTRASWALRLCCCTQLLAIGRRLATIVGRLVLQLHGQVME